MFKLEQVNDCIVYNCVSLFSIQNMSVIIPAIYPGNFVSFPFLLIFRGVFDCIEKNREV